MRAPVCSVVRIPVALVAAFLASAACGGTARAPTSTDPDRERLTAHPASRKSTAQPSDSAPAREASVTSPAPPDAPGEEAGKRSSFPPQDFPPPSNKSAAPGDGRWTLVGDSSLGERAAADPRIVARTVVHPHPESRFITVTIAAIDLPRVALHLVPGTEDIVWAKLKDVESAGLVPAKDRDAIVAVMNGGFQPKHGRWGLSANGVVVQSARKEGCTIALYGDGAARIGPWPALAASEGDMKSYRQTPPCILDAGAVHPALLRGVDKAWAGHTADLTTRRRSAIGIDAAGTTLLYAIGEEASPRWLAEALRVAGAANAAELDINWYWTRFLFFGTDGGVLHVTSTLIPKMEHLRTEYVERPSSRDFFYVTRR